MNKTGMLIATCCLSLMAMPLSTMACDKDKAAGCHGERAVLKVVSTDGSTSCSQSKAKQLVEAARTQAAGTQNAANVRTAADSDGCADGAKQQIVGMLMKSLDGGCGAMCASKGDVVAALRTIASVEEGLVCEKTLAKHMAMANANVRTAGQGVTCTESCSEACKKACAEACKGANAQVVSTGNASACASSKSTQVVSNVKGSTCGSGKNTQVMSKVNGTACGSGKNAQVVSSGAACSSKKNAQVVTTGSGSSCSSAKEAQNAQVVTTGSGSSCSSAKDAQNAQVVTIGSGSSCSSAKDAAIVANVQTAGSSTCNAASAKYVAYGCDKSDRIARSAARAYLEVMRELKLAGDAKGCPNDAASKVLAAVLADMKAEGTTEIAVNFGAMSDAPKKSGGSCQSQR